MKSESLDHPVGASPTDPPLAIKLIGLGGAGGGAVARLLADGRTAIPTLVADTDERRLRGWQAPETLLLGARRWRGLGAGGDPECGCEAAEQEVERLRGFCTGADLVLITAGLGRGTGTGAAPVVARVARQTGALVLGIVTLPFDFEGARCQRQAQAGLRRLRAEADAVFCLPSQRLLQLSSAPVSAMDSFAALHGLLAEAVRSFHRLLTQPGLMRVSLAALCAVLRDRHAEGGFARIEAQGERRVHEVAEQITSHPWLEGGQVFARAGAVVVSIVAGPDLTLAEVETVMAPIHERCGEAPVLVGVAEDPTFQQRLAVTVIVSRSAAQPSQDLPQERTADAAASAPAPTASETEFDTEFFQPSPVPRPAPRLVPPPPELSDAQKQQLLARQRRAASKGAGPRMKQILLPLEITSKGRFAKSEPTIHRGEDLDVPTYIRRGVVLN
jgi:cell division protein FtsZ